MGITTKLYVTEKFDNNLVTIRKSKVKSTQNKPAHPGFRILDLSKLLIFTNSIIPLKRNKVTNEV